MADINCASLWATVYISPLFRRNFRDVHGDDFIRLRWFYGGGCSRKRDSPAGTFENVFHSSRARSFLSLSLSFDLFFPSFAFFLPPLHGSNERMRFMHILENNLNYSWNRFFYGGRVSMYKLWNFRIVIIVILFLRWTNTLSSFESIYVKSEIRSLDDLVKC